MRFRLAALAAAAGLFAAVTPSHAAVQKPQIVDTVGDANGVNQQIPGTGPNPQSVATAPADVAGADIATVLVQTNFVTKRVKGKTVKTPNGFTVTLNLAAATIPQVNYRVSMDTGDCDTSVFFEYDSSAGFESSDVRCPPAQVTGTDTIYGISAKASGSKVSWVVPAGVFRIRSSFSNLNAQTRSSVEGTVTAPQIDFATSAATFVYGK
jgi:hypothetical protein